MKVSLIGSCARQLPDDRQGAWDQTGQHRGGGPRGRQADADPRTHVEADRSLLRGDAHRGGRDGAPVLGRAQHGRLRRGRRRGVRLQVVWRRDGALVSGVLRPLGPPRALTTHPPRDTRLPRASPALPVSLHARSALLHKYRPSAIDFESLKPTDGLSNLELAFATAEKVCRPLRSIGRRGSPRMHASEAPSPTRPPLPLGGGGGGGVPSARVRLQSV